MKGLLTAVTMFAYVFSPPASRLRSRVMRFRSRPQKSPNHRVTPRKNRRKKTLLRRKRLAEGIDARSCAGR